VQSAGLEVHEDQPLVAHHRHLSEHLHHLLVLVALDGHAQHLRLLHLQARALQLLHGFTIHVSPQHL